MKFICVVMKKKAFKKKKYLLFWRKHGQSLALRLRKLYKIIRCLAKVLARDKKKKKKLVLITPSPLAFLMASEIFTSMSLV